MKRSVTVIICLWASLFVVVACSTGGSRSGPMPIGGDGGFLGFPDGSVTKTDGGIGDMTQTAAGSTCPELIDCSNNCTTQACLMACDSNASSTASALYMQLGECVTTTCELDCTDPASIACDTCVSNSQKSADGMSGAGQCSPTNHPACGDCVAELTACANDT